MMRVNPHDYFEALIQAPGEQILELGNEIDELKKTMARWDRVSPAQRNEVVRRLGYFVDRTREIEPVIEVLHEIADHLEVQKSDEDDELAEPTPFMARQQPLFAAVLLFRLAAARAAGDTNKAARLRDDIATYARTSPIEDVRDALVDGMRRDAYEHGETKPGYCIAPLEQLAQNLREPAG